MTKSINKGVQAAFHTKSGYVNLSSQALHEWPGRLVYATLSKTQDGRYTYVTCLPELPPAPIMTANFRRRRINKLKTGGGLVKLEDLCEQANIRDEITCLQFSKSGVPHYIWKTNVLELWDKHVHALYCREAERDNPELKSPRALWYKTA